MLLIQILITHIHIIPALPIALCNTHATRDTGNTRVSAKRLRMSRTLPETDTYTTYLLLLRHTNSNTRVE